MIFLRCILIVGGIGLGACGSSAKAPAGPVTFPAPVLLTTTSDSKALQIAVRTSPSQPPGRGVVSVQYTVTNAQGAGQDGLSLTPQLWMVTMGHGSATTPTVTARGQGIYQLDNVDFFMPGQWQIRTLLVGGQVSDSAAPSFEIP